MKDNELQTMVTSLQAMLDKFAKDHDLKREGMTLRLMVETATWHAKYKAEPAAKAARGEAGTPAAALEALAKNL